MKLLPCTASTAVGLAPSHVYHWSQRLIAFDQTSLVCVDLPITVGFSLENSFSRACLSAWNFPFYRRRFVNAWFIKRLSHLSTFESRVIKMGMDHVRTKRFYLLTATDTKLCPQFDLGWLPFEMKRNEKCTKPLQIKWWAIILSAKER